MMRMRQKRKITR